MNFIGYKTRDGMPEDDEFGIYDYDGSMES